MAETKFLDGAYALDGPEATKALYSDWAEHYDAEVAENGYASPRRCAEALAAAVEDKAAPVLDLGCGTGLSGVAFRAAGFETLDGSDFSPEMLAAAERKGVYRRLIRGDLNEPLPGEEGEYAHIAAVGVFSPGHGPASLIHEVMRLLPAGGCFVFTLNDHAMEDPSYEGAVREVVDGGWAQVLSKDYGEHLPKIEMGSTVYLLNRC
ncbi:MAG: methyltransferase domain-containing protein [Pseudomonadota bacterium]